MRVCTVLLGFGLSYTDSLPFGMHAICGVDEVACRFLPDLHISECVRWLAPFMRYDESFGYGWANSVVELSTKLNAKKILGANATLYILAFFGFVGKWHILRSGNGKFSKIHSACTPYKDKGT